MLSRQRSSGDPVMAQEPLALFFSKKAVHRLWMWPLGRLTPFRSIVTFSCLSPSGAEHNRLLRGGSSEAR